MILSVAIESKKIGVYVGTGVIKKVKVSKNDPNLTVILQIDCTDPLDKDKRQKTPNTKAVYES